MGIRLNVGTGDKIKFLSISDFEANKIGTDKFNNNVYRIDVQVAFKSSVLQGLVPSFISWWTDCKYYHCELSLGNVVWVGANDKEGVYLGTPKPSKLHPNWKLVKVRTIDITEERLDQFITLLNLLNGKPYDMLGIVGSQLFKFGIHSHDKWFCSELVVKLLEALGMPEYFNKKAYEYSPADVYREVNYSKDRSFYASIRK